MRAVQVTEFGGPEVLNLVELAEPEVGADEILIDVDRIGVNYADTHQAENSYLAPSKLPLVPGGEVVGKTAEGQRKVALINSGGYAEKAVANKYMAFDVPEGVDDLHALSMLVQGTTAWVLLKKNAHLETGESVVVHAAAGGVGTIAVQLAKAWGAGRVIATASSEEKRRLAMELGADATVDSNAENMTEALIEANGGKRIDVILDMVGGTTTDQSIAALAPFGRLAFYGMASRKQPKAVELRNLLGHSTTVTGMWLPHVFRLPGNVFGTALNDLFTLIQAGKLKAIAGGEYPLEDARKAHEALRSRGTVGKLLLDPRK
ncbi:zinc-binding dehydrogenase [Amycolatopsis rhabdoformis]|uniref:Zinc-binding dehydrogenase n=1 Tax=Amycolatopsis rhabdoformis TaxID=1448059 RepID=A0ABZ1I0G5_9PSEU|nr:zinc-binding dehydrogenase [Amycolatopsis rhabdoformis]WSE27287.1 zinc-binding dehydrogenase [Amycolatopsis rhabdoformis]